MIPGAVAAALGQLGDPRFRRVVLQGLALSAALLVALYALLVLAIRWLVGDTITLPWIGEVGGIDTFLSVASIPVMLVLSVFLMVPVASAFTGFFLDTVADAVEEKHFPALPPARAIGLWETITDSLRNFVLLVALNLVGLIIVVFTAGTGLIIFWLINGFLLSREYFTMVALRRMPAPEAQALRKRHQTRLWIAGILFAIPLSVPVLNLIVPVLGVAAFTHLFHRLVRP